MIRAIILALMLASCTKPPIDGFCERFQAKDFKDRGLRAQNDHNKRADNVNENTRIRDCGPATSGLKPGPK